jgi:ribosomal protein L11 methyltransferase
MTRLIRVAVRARGDDTEPLRARLLELVPAGFEERDADGVVELAIYVAAEEAGALLAELPLATFQPVEDGWGDSWRAFHRPVLVGGLWLGPPWERPPDPSRAVVIDPGRAFGTGSHPTTHLCVALLAGTTARGSLLDVGCGSGVLAIAASRLGFAPLLAIDVDEVAVETTRANAAANGVELDARVVDALSGRLPAADVAVANVLLAPVETILARLDATEAITSGYLAGERPAHHGWAHVDTIELDGWAADRFRR